VKNQALKKGVLKKVNSWVIVLFSELNY